MTTTIKANSKKEFEELKKEFRNKGYNFVTFANKIAEMESIDGKHFVIITR